MLKELQDSVKARLYDFQSTPFLASVIISWILINHKYLMIYFSDYDLKKRIELLNGVHNEWWLYLIFFYILPISFGFFYVYCYPWMNQKFYDFTLQKRKKLKEIKQKIEDEMPFSQKEANELMQINFTLQNEKDELYRKYNVLKQEYEVKLEEETKALQYKIDTQKKLIEKTNNLLDDCNKKSNENFGEFSEKIKALEDEKNSLIQINNEIKKHFADTNKEYNRLSNENENYKIEFKRIKDKKFKKASFDEVLRYLYDSGFRTSTLDDFRDNLADTFGISAARVEHTINQLEIKKIVHITGGRISILPGGVDLLLNMFEDDKK